jgi:hypothetical protein
MIVNFSGAALARQDDMGAIMPARLLSRLQNSIFLPHRALLTKHPSTHAWRHSELLSTSATKIRHTFPHIAAHV